MYEAKKSWDKFDKRNLGNTILQEFMTWLVFYLLMQSRYTSNILAIIYAASFELLQHITFPTVLTSPPTLAHIWNNPQVWNSSQTLRPPRSSWAEQRSKFQGDEEQPVLQQRKQVPLSPTGWLSALFPFFMQKSDSIKQTRQEYVNRAGYRKRPNIYTCLFFMIRWEYNENGYINKEHEKTNQIKWENSDKGSMCAFTQENIKSINKIMRRHIPKQWCLFGSHEFLMCYTPHALWR